MYKKRNILTLSLLLILVNAFPSYAVKAPKATISPWSVNDLIDAQRQGIIPSTALSESKDLRKNIIPDELSDLDNLSRKKLETYNLTKNTKYEKSDLKYYTNKENILNIIFDMLSQYEDTTNQNAVKFLSEKSIYRGSGNPEDLIKPASFEESICLFNRATTYIIEKNNFSSKGMLYSVENNGNKVYLYGSIHIGDNSMYPIQKNVMDAFYASDEIFVEVNVQDKEKIEHMSNEMYHNDGKTLKDDLGDELYLKFKSFMDSYDVSEDYYNSLKPWSAYNMISNLPMNIKMPNASALGIDKYFIYKANANNKKINELESIELQTNLLSEFSEEEYKSMINSFIDTANKYGLDIFTKSSENLKTIWKNGDEKALNDTLDKDNSFTGNLFDERDINMANKIEEVLKSNEKKTYFIIAGAAHFTPEDSIIKLLENKGFKVNK